MRKRIFFIMEGNNGATYFFNARNWKSISYSLKFYKARTLKQIISKLSLKIYLFFLGIFCQLINCSILKSIDELTKLLGKIGVGEVNFDLDDNCSVLISPTKNKIIVHYHEKESFHKFAFEKSLIKAQNEASIYKLFRVPLTHFRVSNIKNILKGKGFFSFKLSNETSRKQLPVGNKVDLVSALVELFNTTSDSSCTLLEYIQRLQSRYTISYENTSFIKQILDVLKRQHGNKQMPLGLVHRDFKPWNISDHDGLLIYDFEEAVTNGPPLEDLFNFFIDPEIRYKTNNDIVAMLFHPNKIKLYHSYLSQLGLDIDFKILLNIYLIERTLFWFSEGEIETSDKFLELISYIFEGLERS